MAGRSLVELELERLKEWKKYYERPLYYARRIKAAVRRLDPRAKVVLFGSLVKGGMRPDSDIDVLVVTELAGRVGDRLKLRVEIAREIGECTPFEIHIVTPGEYEGWYKKFIDKHVVV